MATYLITGCGGFIGHYLAKSLTEAGHHVFGTFHTQRIDVVKVNAIQCDIKNRTLVDEVISRTKPDVIYHLAAQSNIKRSWENWEHTFQTNALGTQNVFEAIRTNKITPRIIIFGSSSQYGSALLDQQKQAQNMVFCPTSPYALSKVVQYYCGRMYHDVFDMDVVTVLPFYVIGPRKSQDAPSDFARKIIQFENGELDNLEVGNLNVERDVVDVRDAVKALQHIEKRAQSGSTYDLCTGQATTLKLILGRLISLSGSSIPISVCPDKFRKGENYRIIGNSKPLKNLGWKPKNELDDTLKSILDYWRTNQFVSNAS